MLSAPYNCGIWFDCKTSWMANSKKEEDRRQRLYSYSSLYHSTVRKIVLMKGLKLCWRDSCREKREEIFFWFSSWKINHHHSFNILSDVYFGWLFCSSFSFSTWYAAYYIFLAFHINNTKSREMIMTLKTIIFFFTSFVCTIKIWKLLSTCPMILLTHPKLNS